MELFTRTASGQSAQHLFHDGKVVVWLEGPSDVLAYHPLLSQYDCVLKSAGSKARCLEIAARMPLPDSPYVVIVDGDYDILSIGRSSHKQLVWLHRYSIENYFINSSVLEYACMSHAPLSDRASGAECMAEIQAALASVKDLIGLDVGVRSRGLGVRVLPQKFERVAEAPTSTRVSAEAVADLVESCPVDVGDLDDELFQVESYGLDRIARGHFVFGLVRNAIKKEVIKRGEKIYSNDRSILIFLSSILWRINCDKDHISLRRRIKSAIRIAKSYISKV